jgi:hypothetical protein
MNRSIRIEASNRVPSGRLVQASGYEFVLVFVCSCVVANFAEVGSAVLLFVVSAPTGPKVLEEWIPLLSGVASAGVWLGLRRSAGSACFVPVSGSSLCLQLPI